MFEASKRLKGWWWWCRSSKKIKKIQIQTKKYTNIKSGRSQLRRIGQRPPRLMAGVAEAAKKQNYINPN